MTHRSPVARSDEVIVPGPIDDESETGPTAGAEDTEAVEELRWSRSSESPDASPHGGGLG
jgi:hypothetical protein